MDNSQLIPDELMTTALFSPTPTEIAATINDKDGNPQQVQVLTTADCHPQLIQVLTDSEGCPQSLQVLADGRVVNEDSEACRNIIENGEAGLSLIQPTGENVWVNSQVQYVVIQKDDNAADSLEAKSANPLTGEEQLDDDGFDKLQCGLCGKIVVGDVQQFLFHKSTHVARGMGLGCEVCGLSFSRQLALTQHYRRKHRILLGESKPSKSVPKPPVRPHRRATNHQHKPPEPLQDFRVGAEALQSVVDFNSIKHLSEEVAKEVVDVGEEVEETMSDLDETTIGNEEETAIGNVEETTIGNVETIIGNVEETIIGNIENTTTGNVEETTIGNIEERTIGNVEDKMIGNVEETTIGNVKETTIGNNQAAEQNCAECCGDSTQECMEVVNETKICDTTETEVEEAMHVVGNKRSAHFIEGDMLRVQGEHQDVTEVSEVLPVESEETVIADMPADVRHSVTVPRVVHVAETDLTEVDVIDVGNSSEKENTVIGDEHIQTYCPDNRQHKLADLASEKMLKLSQSVKVLARELDMPDFHFIPVIERRSKRSHIQGGRYGFRCLYCDLKVSWRSTLCKHMREKHADILKVGPLLNIPDTVAGEHDVMKMSDYIKLETRPSGKRVRGVETQDLPGEYLCDKCDKVFSRLRYLRKHQIVHKLEKDLLCTVCVKSFRTLANLKQHMKIHKDRNAYKCSECDFESTVNIAIHTHRQIHSKGCVLCEICGSAYTDKSTLTKHKQVHNPLRPFACQYPACTWRFNTKAMCSAHFRSHTTKGKFECNVCGYAFRQKHHLQRHEKKVHNIVREHKPAYPRYLEPVAIPYSREESASRLVPSGSDRLAPSSCENVQEVSLVINEGSEVSVDTGDDHFDLESALQTGQLVIATEDGSTINYEMSDIGMNMSYQTLLQDSDGNQLDTHAILVPQSDGSHIVYQHEEVAETVSTEDKD